MSTRQLAIAGAASLALLAGGATIAKAAPITTNPGVLTSNGSNVTAIFVFSDAADTDLLSLVGGPQNFFNNQTTPVASTFNLGNPSGTLTFRLDDTTLGTSYETGLTTSDDPGVYHAVYSTDFTTFGDGPLPASVAALIAGLPAGTTITYVAWEDHNAAENSDYDYNDLVFGFTNLSVTTPEPGTLLLFGAGLTALSALRRRNRN